MGIRLIISLTILLTCICINVNAQVAARFRVTAFSSQSTSVFSVSNEMEVYPEMTVYIPNAFTPNDDGVNDTFGVVGAGIANFSMVIYNRWGQLMFESTEVDQHWDGTYKGNTPALGSYFYSITAQGLKGARQTKNGSFDLIR